MSSTNYKWTIYLLSRKSIVEDRALICDMANSPLRGRFGLANRSASRSKEVIKGINGLLHILSEQVNRAYCVPMQSGGGKGVGQRVPRET